MVDFLTLTPVCKGQTLGFSCYDLYALFKGYGLNQFSEILIVPYLLWLVNYQFLLLTLRHLKYAELA